MAKTKNSEHWTGLVKMGGHNSKYDVSKTKEFQKISESEKSRLEKRCIALYVVKNKTQ